MKSIATKTSILWVAATTVSAYKQELQELSKMIENNVYHRFAKRFFEVLLVDINRAIEIFDKINALGYRFVNAALFSWVVQDLKKLGIAVEAALPDVKVSR